MLSDSFDYARRVSKTGCGNGKVLESAAFEICKSIVNGVKIIDVWKECQQIYCSTDQNGSRKNTE